MSNQTLRITRPRIPPLEIRLLALPPARLCKVQMYDYDFAHVWLLVMFSDLAEQQELLGCRIGQSNEATSAELDTEIIRFPVPRL